MFSSIPFHFVLLSAGEVLKEDEFVTPQKMQNLLARDECFSIRIPLDECRLALDLLKESGFLIEYSDGYRRNIDSDKRRIY